MNIEQVQRDLYGLADVDLNQVLQLLRDAEDTSRKIPTYKGKFITDKILNARNELVKISNYLKTYSPKEETDSGQAIG